jgi:SNF2 family DNA or RNA helicase
MPNHSAELWPMLRSLWPERCPYSFEQFREKFCELRWDDYRKDWKVIGNKNVDELRAMMKGTFLRRLKKDHLDLPPIRWETMVLQPTEMPARLLEISAELEDMPVEDVLHALSMHTSFAEWRHLCGQAKIEPAGELLEMELLGGMPKVLIAAHHLAVLDGLQTRLAQFNPVRFSGEVSAKQRQGNVDQFQSDPACRVALCQIQAGGVGITLTAAAEVVFVEQSFVPGDNAQLADRVHRIGQNQQVRARFLALTNSVDAVVAEALARKSAAISEVLGEKAVGA